MATEEPGPAGGEMLEAMDGASATVEDTLKHMQDHNEGVGVCDTETCRWQISKSSGVKIVHPVWLLHHSLGLSNNLLD